MAYRYIDEDQNFILLQTPEDWLQFQQQNSNENCRVWGTPPGYPCLFYASYACFNDYYGYDCLFVTIEQITNAMSTKEE